MKYTKNLRLLSIFTVLCLCFTFFSAGAGAAEKKVTKNGAAAIVETAVAQTGNYGGNKFKRDMGYYGPWCACFVTWCARETGVPEDTIPTTFSCSSMRNYFRNKGLYHSAKAYGGNYIPKPGDLVFFSDSGYSESLTHMGIVISADNYNIYCIEGNCGNQVKQIRRYYNYYTVGFATPEYSDVDVLSPESNDKTAVSSSKTGIYRVNDATNLRTSPSVSGEIITTLIMGTEFTVTEVNGDWGKTNFGGNEGWICLSWSSKTADLPGVVPGDVDNDGQITASDARITLRASVGLESLDNNQKIAAAVDSSENVTASCARTILRVSVNLDEI